MSSVESSARASVDAPSSRRFARTPTPLGDMLVAAEGDVLVGAYFDGQKHQPARAWFGSDVTDVLTADPVLHRTCEQLTEYFTGSRRTFDLPLGPEGTPFQQQVWAALVRIRPGTTRTYGSLAEELAEPDASVSGLAQGVGQAVGHNPISVIVPCHRVVGADGSLTGFAGGLDRKRWLLTHEETDETRENRLF